MNYNFKIGLGTVQFGLPYGISNTNGQTTSKEVSLILDVARSNGIDIIDTASVYRISEEVLGCNKLSGFKIVSKFMPDQNGLNISQQLDRSLGLMNVSTLYGYLAHRPSDVLANPRKWDELNDLKKNGVVSKIGFSFNEPSEIDCILEKGWIPDLIQAPFNYFDNRFEKYFIYLKERGCEVHSRSTFLQGLFFMRPEMIPPIFDLVKSTIATLHQKKEKLAGMLLNYCAQQKFIDKVIVGVNNSEQLIANFASMNSNETLPKLFIDLPDEILTPSRWKINNLK